MMTTRRGAKVLVTGGAGFIGSNLIKQLLEDCPHIYSIVSLDNYWTGKEENHIEHDNIIYLDGNTWDIEKILDKTSFDTVFHFGEYSRIVKSFDDIDYVMKTNLHGTTRVLEMCRKWGAKFIYSASSSKFGDDGRDENLNPYSWAKAKIVELVKNYGKWYGLRYEICYFFNVYGPSQIKTGEYATVIGVFERQMRRGEALTVVRPGTQTRDFTYVGDLVRGVVKTIEMNMNHEWHLRSGINISILDVAKLYSSKWTYIPERRGERFSSEEFPSDTLEVLGWEPEITLQRWIASRRIV